MYQVFARGITLTTLLVLALPLHAGNGDKGRNVLLRGDYAMTLSQTCVRTQGAGIDPESLELQADAEIVTAVTSGILHFNGSGEFSLLGVSTDLLHNQTAIGDIPVQPGIEIACDGTYSVQPDRSFTTEATCSFEAAPSVPATLSPVRSQGHIGLNGHVVISSDIEPTIETITVLVDDVPLVVQEAICTQIGQGIKRSPVSFE